MPKNAIVAVDFSNITSAFEDIRRKSGLDPRSKLDLEKLVNIATMGSNVASKTVYVETRSTDDQVGQRKFLYQFSVKGFNVVTKEVKRIWTGVGTKEKANFDVEITTDISDSFWRRDCDEIILLSGDSDFEYLLSKIKKRGGISVTIVSSDDTVSRELRALADRLILIGHDVKMEEISFINSKSAQ
ncbi:MAG TPA: NYN domain-containing protein [Candidatus Moranbacteria bacterium]|nr:NYN domain-containing protein [Candidatus Moranbacteria bacterium]HRZ33452.1 NYN domain-containing protein [Candidatus Moranbacteria bacterium]